MSLSKTLASLTVLSALTALAGSSHAAITGASGQANWLLSAPASALPGALPGLPAYCWDEKTNVNHSGLNVNITSNGVYTGNTFYSGVVSGMFDSHMIHFDASSGVANAQGAVTFSSNVVAVIYDNVLLDLTDASLGHPSTIYPTTNPQRSSSLFLGPSTVVVSGNVVQFDLWITPANFMSELRVLTHSVPTPGSMALLGLGGLTCLRRRR
ncbi:MAG: hypothetical protein AABZ53_07930 [Planctomycetota bacterium]